MTNEEKILLYMFEHKEEGELSIEKIASFTGLDVAEVQERLQLMQETGLVSGPEPLLSRSMRCLKEIDVKFEATAKGYSEHIILIASALEKADEEFLARELGYDTEFVSIVGSRLRTAGIWRGNAVEENHYQNWLKDGFAFFIDGAVATGDMMIVGGTRDNPNYQMTPGGKSEVAKIIDDMGKK